MNIWHEDDRFWHTMAPFLFGRERWERAAQEIEDLLALTEIPAGSTVLDLCCGPGRHSLELADRGFCVTAVDRSQEYLDEARKQARERGLDIEFAQEDMRRFRRAGAFHMAISLYTSFGYFGDPEEDLQVARNLYDSLVADGKLVMELMGREVLTRVFRPRDWQPIEEGGFFLEDRHPSPDWTWMENRWILIRQGQVEEFNISHRLYGAADLSRLLQRAGFKQATPFGDLAGAPYDHTAKRLVMVAVK
jgi:SAM-dependent methyltransferase